MTISPSKPIRVMLIDDNTMVHIGLATFLKAFDDLELAGEGENGSAAIQLCAKLQPNVILMDMVMPDMNGATATRTIRQQFPNVQVIALTSFKEEELVNSALEAGAVGSGIKELRTPYRTPQANGMCERFMGSLRRECLDHTLIHHGQHLQRW